MSKLFNWFKKDKTTQELEQDNNLPSTTRQADINEQPKPILADEQIHIAKTEDTAPVESQVLASTKVSTENLNVESLHNQTSDAAQIPISENTISDEVSGKE